MNRMPSCDDSDFRWIVSRGTKCLGSIIQVDLLISFSISCNGV